MTKFLGEKCFCVILISSQSIHVYSTVTLSEKSVNVYFGFTNHAKICVSQHMDCFV